MEVKELKKVTKLHPYTINEFVKDLVDTRKNIEEENKDIDVRIRGIEIKKKEISDAADRNSADSIKELEEELSKENEKKEQANETIKKWEAEKARIIQELDKKIEKFRTSVKENEDKKAEQENKIKENGEKMTEIYEKAESTPPFTLPKEYYDLQNENKDINKKISRIKGNLTRYDKKINDLIEVKGNLENENVLEGLQPPRTINRARTRDGRLVVQEKPVQEKPVQEKPVQEKPVQEKPVQEKPVEATKPYSEMTKEELENKKRELYAKIVEGDDYYWRAHHENGMEEHGNDPIDTELKLIQEELNKRKEKEESIRDDEVKPEEEKEGLPAEIKKPNIFKRIGNWIKKTAGKIKDNFRNAFKDETETKTEEKAEEVKEDRTDFVQKVDIDYDKVLESVLSGEEKPIDLEKEER